MDRLRSILFSLVCLVGLSCVLLLKGAEHSPLPVDTSEICKDFSQLEGREYEHFHKPHLSTLVDGTFQSDFEQYVADSLPLRDQALLLNASVQRASIALANRVFGFSSYPTFYGSNYVYVPEYDAVSQSLRPVTNANLQAMERTATSLNALADAYGDISFYLLALDRPDASDANPTASLVSNPLVYSVVDERLYSKLNTNIQISRFLYHNEEELYESLYRTDHHWQTRTAYGCYANQISLMIPGAIPAPILQYVAYEDIDFRGACSRTGLCAPIEPDCVDDCIIDMSSYTVVRDDAEFDGEVLAHREMYLTGTFNPDPFANRYAEYFHGDWGLWRIDNPDAQTNRSLLLLRDSYGGCVERFFAANYAHVYVADFRHTNETVAELLDEHKDIEDVLILMGWNNLTSEASLAGFSI